MGTTDMLVDASRNSPPATNHGDTCWSEDLSPSVEAISLEELDAGDSDFSWSSVVSAPSTPGSDLSASNSEPTPATGDNVAQELTRSQTEQGSKTSMEKHSLYFWDSITFKVEGVFFQLPKYRFVEESETFMAMVAPLDVALRDFEHFLKAFLPRASAMYDAEPGLSQDEWISVLKLSTLWRFNELRKLAISHLSWSWPRPTMDPIDRICLAKEYRVYDWLLQGYQQEGEKIGMEVALELSGRKAPLRDQEFECIRVEGTQFMTKAERMEETRVEEGLKRNQKAKKSQRGAKKDEYQEEGKQLKQECALRLKDEKKEEHAIAQRLKEEEALSGRGPRRRSRTRAITRSRRIEEELRRGRKIEEMEKPIQQEEQEKREEEKEKEAQAQAPSFGFGTSVLLFGGMGSTLGSTFLKPSNLFGSGTDDEEDKGSGWGFGGSNERISPPAEIPKGISSFNRGRSVGPEQRGNRDSTSLFGSASKHPVFDSSPPPPVTVSQSSIPTEGREGSQQPTRSSTPQPPIQPLPPMQPGIAPPFVLATPMEEPAPAKAKVPTDSLASKMDNNFEEAFETPAAGDRLEDTWGQQNINNEVTGVHPTPKVEKKGLIELLD
ncbi:hypothetical protein BKA70DRAFT_1286143, partial [Coprinopsis sp. MPI-PUGE-AT-0042]